MHADQSAEAAPSGVLYVGLMSGTSLDGIDAALVRFDGTGVAPSDARLEAFRTTPFDPDLEHRLRRAVAGDADTDELCDLDFALGEALAAAAAEIAEGADGPIAAVGSHGQTVRHRPPGPARRGSTLQIGEAAVIAERTGLEVIADFRVRDVAAGGHGAPLAPLFDDLLLRAEGHARAIQNIGGMGNVTALPPAGDAATRPIAFDTGPGVALIDAAVRRLTGGERSFDEDGRLAAAGTADEAAVDEWLSDPFFAETPPRSTGRERFGAARVEAWLSAHPGLSAEDAAATLTEVTARSIAESYGLIGFAVDDVVLCGGGARNPEIARRIAAHLDDGARVRTLDEIGWDPDAREAAAFALLARQHLLGHPVDLSWATGATGPRRLGKGVPA
ncbi:MAG: anhydro-N-acetylmuramic acid kinase [Gemmatimonadota bacterium]